MCPQSPPRLFIINTIERNEGALSLCLGNLLRNGKKNGKQTEQLVVISAHLRAPGGVCYQSSQDLPFGTPTELSLLQKAKQHE